MKNNLCIVLGLSFLLSSLTSCEPEDELNALKTSDSTIEINPSSQLQVESKSYDREQIESVSCDAIETTILYAGQDIDIGYVHISNSEKELYIQYDLSQTSRSLIETHLYVGNQEDIPYTNSGNPKIGHFQYHATQDYSNNKSYIYSIPLEDLDDCFVVIAHAVVSGSDKNQGTETAFGYGKHEFSGNRWGWYMDYCQQECEDAGENGDDESFDGSTGGNETDSSVGFTGIDNGFDDCIEGYAFNAANQADSRCFLSDGFEQWGWTNQVFYDYRANYVTGYSQNFPLLASAFQCDISNSLEVGYLSLTVTGGDGQYYADMEFVITDLTYNLEDIDLYVGNRAYPLDGSNNPSISTDLFNYMASSVNSKNHLFKDVPWPAEANFIGRVTVCPTN